MSDPAKAVRLFVAVDLALGPTRTIADAVARLAPVARERGLRVAWVPPENLHVTVKFLGWTRPEVVGAIHDRLRDGLARRHGFDLRARGAGAFPNESRPRVLWVGIEDPSGELARLAADVDGWAERLGFPRETRPFSAHLTIGRVKEGRGAEELLAPLHDVDFGRSFVRSVVLYESVMKSTGSVYTPRLVVPLGGAPTRPDRQTREVKEVSTETNEEPEPHG